MPTHLVTIEFQKFGGLPYTEFEARRLGEDEHGVWLMSPSPLRMRLPAMNEAWFEVDWGCLWLLPPEPAAWMMLARCDEDTVAFDVCGERAWQSDSHVVAVDLDVDVYWAADGRAVHDTLQRSCRHVSPITIAGETELVMNAQALHYPPEIVARARRGQQEIEALLAAGPPFPEQRALYC